MARRTAAFIGLLPVTRVAGHGWLAMPPARNSQKGDRNNYCPQCGNGDGICGDGGQWPDDSNYIDAQAAPAASWTEGSIVEVDVKLTAHHKGHFAFSICDKTITSSLEDAQSCLDDHVLERASSEEVGVSNCKAGDKRAVCQPVDPRHKERFYLPPPGFSPDGTNFYKIYLKLPLGLTCRACTLQWRWWSANSCIPAPDYLCLLQR
eukprot:TRINITY_DN49585_c0_g1_i1.p1 TRINITY_DN49585_c0_g1~~TRINITY_DN49585_c0_g1_i1.p1  ORF type:complete len:206 (-),score=25.43 TRINITY_DN49585_c0_g1_i1:995-1612(-)